MRLQVKTIKQAVFLLHWGCLFISVPKIPEPFRPNRIKQRVFIWGGDNRKDQGENCRIHAEVWVP